MPMCPPPIGESQQKPMPFPSFYSLGPSSLTIIIYFLSPFLSALPSLIRSPLSSPEFRRHVCQNPIFEWSSRLLSK
jgi:hypothetical protein